MIAAPGLKRPLVDIAGLADQVPPPGVALSCTGGLMSQSGCGIVRVGVKGLKMVSVIVFRIGQFWTVGLTTTL